MISVFEIGRMEDADWGDIVVEELGYSVGFRVAVRYDGADRGHMGECSLIFGFVYFGE